MHFNFLTSMNIFSCGKKVAVINKNAADKCHKWERGKRGAYYHTLVKCAIYDSNEVCRFVCSGIVVKNLEEYLITFRMEFSIKHTLYVE